MKHDVTVIGSGPGGYVAAIRCAQLGFNTAIIEKYPTLGGTCLNVGCIPSKALLDSSEHYYNAKNKFETHGIKMDKLGLDFTQMIKRKDEVVKQTCDGVAFLMKKNKITVYEGLGSFVDETTIQVKPAKGKAQKIQTDKTIIATGSKPATLPGIKIDKKRVITSTEALSLTEVPKKLILIGGGIIGLEMGSVFARLGSEVIVLEFLDGIIAGMDVDLGSELIKVLKKEGMKFHLKHEVTGLSVKGKTVTVDALDDKDKKIKFTGDYCLVAVGRKPYTAGLGLEKVGIELDEKGRIPTNELLQTSKTNIYAIGDVIQGAMLAHKAEDEGVFVAEHLAGQKPHINYLLIPGVVYTWPEVAGVGYTEEQLKEMGTAYKKGKFPFRASGRAKASMDQDGFVKVLADKENDEILGIHMIGPRAADMIAEAVVAMEYRASAEDIGRMCHAHPTFTEALKEAALAATDERSLHL